MEAKITELIAQVKGTAVGDIRLDSSSHLINDAALDSLQMLNLVLLVEDEFNVEVDFDSFNVEHLSSLSRFANYIRGLPKS